MFRKELTNERGERVVFADGIRIAEFLFEFKPNWWTCKMHLIRSLFEIQSCLDAHAYISTVSTIQWMPFGKHQSLNRTRWIRSAECFLATSCYVALLCCSCCVFPPDRTGRAPLVFLQFFNLKIFNPLKRLRETDLPLFENFFWSTLFAKLFESFLEVHSAIFSPNPLSSQSRLFSS